ncbi:hypothetical protein CS0771_09000 [Catellatospora sp. IY07-71]|uniref:hypothetical protein n=1 Tax=Catellatospora sp. IY07-71 TaxID=2728827 RepID=UPI001BB332A4|nr:hypothetical protein [Catellatospora sp. IY07-71]BCJ71356.1 hypothetical protein CS0771_09000 [Catellatospora sp. IY07-71]
MNLNAEFFALSAYGGQLSALRLGPMVLLGIALLLLGVGLLVLAVVLVRRSAE